MEQKKMYKYKILALDDEMLILLTLKASLKNSDYEVHTAQNIAAAMELFYAHKYDAILCDILIGEANGFDFRDSVRKYSKNIPIIFLSSLVNDLKNTLLNQISQDANSYFINKNYKKKELVDKLENVIAFYQTKKDILSLKKELKSSLSLARNIQYAILPPAFDNDEYMKYSYIYRPLQEVSGDLFVYLPLGEGRYISILGDISGHGIHAAMTMCAVTTLLQSYVTINENITPEIILNMLHEYFLKYFNIAVYMTCLVSVWDFQKNKIIYQKAGAPDMLCFNGKTGDKIEINPGNKGDLPIGMLSSVIYAKDNNVEYDFDDDDIFYQLSDGVLDIVQPQNDNDALDMELLCSLLSNLAKDNPLITLPYSCYSQLEKIGYSKLTDDFTLVATGKKTPNSSTILKSHSKNDIDKFIQYSIDFIKTQRDDQKLIEQSKEILSSFLKMVLKDTPKHFGKSNMISLRTFFDKENLYFIICHFDETKEQSSHLIKNDLDLSSIFNIATTVKRNKYDHLNETIIAIKTTEI